MRWLDGITIQHEFERTPGDGEGQGRLVCCSLWGHEESDTTKRLSLKDKRAAAMHRRYPVTGTHAKILMWNRDRVVNRN